MKPGLLIASGGIDSTVLAHELATVGALRGMVSFNYGQLAWYTGYKKLRYHARKLKTWARPMTFEIPLVPANAGVFIKGFKPTRPDDAGGRIPDTDVQRWRQEQFSYIEGRNSLFILHAASLALSKGIDTLYVGFQFERETWELDETGNDTGPCFVTAMNDLLQYAVSGPMTLVAPYLDRQLDKEQIVSLGRALGVNLNMTYSYEFLPACGVCGACKRRRRALTG